MTTTGRNLTPLGQLLETARTQVLRISGRKAALRAGISEARWRQVVTGVQMRGGTDVGARPTDRTVVAMALAVGVNPADALMAAGLPVEDVDALVADIQAESSAEPSHPADAMADEVERIGQLSGISARDRIRMVKALIDLYEEETSASADQG